LDELEMWNTIFHMAEQKVGLSAGKGIEAADILDF
jgi:hypothetical protein